MEAASSSETLVPPYETTWCHVWNICSTRTLVPASHPPSKVQTHCLLALSPGMWLLWNILRLDDAAVFYTCVVKPPAPVSSFFGRPDRFTVLKCNHRKVSSVIFLFKHFKEQKSPKLFGAQHLPSVSSLPHASDSPLQSPAVPPGGRWWESDAPDFCCLQIHI